MADARLLVAMLRTPADLAGLDVRSWNDLIRLARAESLLGQLAIAANAAAVLPACPARVRTIFADQLAAIAASQRTARWEARQAARALAPLGIPVVLLKGAAYLIAAVPAADGRSIGDLDILIPRAAIDAAEAALKAAGWSSLKDDPYDDAYYRRWMHEIPPLAHEERGTVIDVHHTILPLTARLRPDADALIADALPVGDGLSVLAPADMLLHSVAHCFYDGEFEGGLRNLWDIHLMVSEFARLSGFWVDLADRAQRHQLARPLGRALRISRSLYGTAVDTGLAGPPAITDALFAARLLACDGWGRPTRPWLRRAFYLRGHWLRMPPMMLARHLWTKWRMGHRG